MIPNVRIFQDKCGRIQENAYYIVYNDNNNTSTTEDNLKETQALQQVCKQLQQCLDAINVAIANDQRCENNADCTPSQI